MSIILHVITAITRPENLTKITDSLVVACKDYTCDIVWHWRHDWKREHVGGQKLKNDALDIIDNGWVFFLDDDTHLSPYIPQLIAERDANPLLDGFIVEQQRADGSILVTSPDNVRWGCIDIGQAVLRRSAIGDHRIPEEYIGDGLFLEKLIPTLNVEFVPIVASYHNCL